MSGDKDSKTEEPTQQKLKEARKKGQVARSEEFAPTLMFVFAVLYFWFGWDSMFVNIKEVITSIPFIYTMDFPLALDNVLDKVMSKVIYSIVLPFAILMLIAGILGNVLQTGILFSVDPVTPKGEKISPIKGFGRIFSIKQVIKTLFSIIKILGMSIIIVYVVRLGIRDYMHDISQCDVRCQMLVFQTLLKKLVMILLPILVVVAAMDFMFQKSQFTKDQRMSKDEIKREYKNQEGDPEIKGARKQEQQKMLEQDLNKKVKESRVVIVGMNLAVALKYDEDLPLPILLAIGKDRMSFKMIEIANKERVKVIADPDLAGKLAKEGDIDQYIPSSTIEGAARAIQQAAE
ncbi:MAG: EscU/YscU/HrcU family type III secretion system export apparatus switch protein [Cocleimonas sp.]|nr:EscU/YscU/HrcU family type III secretion system export apparatus switch protein [Cocleimonas sp.]